MAPMSFSMAPPCTLGFTAIQKRLRFDPTPLFATRFPTHLWTPSCYLLAFFPGFLGGGGPPTLSPALVSQPHSFYTPDIFQESFRGWTLFTALFLTVFQGVILQCSSPLLGLNDFYPKLKLFPAIFRPVSWLAPATFRAISGRFLGGQALTRAAWPLPARQRLLRIIYRTISRSYSGIFQRVLSRWVDVSLNRSQMDLTGFCQKPNWPRYLPDSF